MSVRELLDSLAPDDQLALGTNDEERIKAIADMRQQAYVEQLAEMHSDPRIDRWEQLMSAKYGPLVKVHNNNLMHWRAALLVVRYGEAPYHWPDKWSDDDVRRADRWLRGDTPFGVTYVPRSNV